MSAFSNASALVKGAVLSTFGEKVQILDSDKTTVICTIDAHISHRVEEPSEYQSITVELHTLKVDRAQAHYLKSGRYIKAAGKLYQLKAPADPSKFTRGGVTTDHFVFWYMT
jgi:hypothetical protein